MNDVSDPPRVLVVSDDHGPRNTCADEKLPTSDISGISVVYMHPASEREEGDLFLNETYANSTVF